ncbi:MAG: hypothetical protein R2806_20645 [Saprospiraceae bacterium]
MVLRILLFIIRWALYVTLPFILLIRGGVYLHTHYFLPGWICITGGAGMAAFVLFLYVYLIQRRFFKPVSSPHGQRTFLFALLVVGAYCLQSAFYLSGVHAKSSGVQAEFVELHPLLRLSVSTLIHLDRHLLITDAGRWPEDYRKMGLGSKSQSLHFRQSDGYTHALDVRTRDRSWLRNQLLTIYFRAMGFYTLRHGGTGDHLHVSLQSWDRPGGR